jgi:SAM-dependent methyltransferase
MDYSKIISACEERKHLVSMVPIERIIELGYNIGLGADTTALDLCCGFGTMLKIWSEAFGISGTGVDREPEFIKIGKARLTSERVTLICDDVLRYSSAVRFGVVLCTELSDGIDGTFSNLGDSISFLERYAEPNGTLIFGKAFSKIENPPQELVEFEGELPTLGELNRDIRALGYHFTAMATDTHAEWERHITSNARAAIQHLRERPDDADFAAWDDKWYRIYFEQRRRYEGWGLFAIEKI